jgi:hypothetical protein
MMTQFRATGRDLPRLEALLYEYALSEGMLE